MSKSIFFLFFLFFSCAKMDVNDELLEKSDLLEDLGVSNLGVIEKRPSEALVPSQYQVPYRSFLKNQNLTEGFNETQMASEEFIHFPDEAFVHEKDKQEASSLNFPVSLKKVEQEDLEEDLEEETEVRKEAQEEFIYPVEVVEENNLQQKTSLSKSFVLEEFYQKERDSKSKKVDILFLIDHTDSLKEEYFTLSKRIYELLDNYRDLQWNIGFLTALYQINQTTAKKDLFWSYKDLSYKEKNISKRLYNIFNSLKKDQRVACLGDFCPYYPKLFDILYSFLKKDLNTQEFLRPQADYLSIIFVTDRDLEDKHHPVFELLKAYNYSFSSISIPSSETMSEETVHECYQMRNLVNPIANFSYYLNKLVLNKNGFIGDICEPYYISSLLSQKNTLHTAFSLSKEPLLKTMSVTIFPTQNKNIRWMSKKKKIYFDKPPSAGSVIEILYESK